MKQVNFNTKGTKMKYLLIVLFLSIDVLANEYQMDLGYSQIEHAWRGPNNVATYNPSMKSIGLTYIHDSCFALRFGYGELNHSETTGRYSDLVLEMDYIISLEVMYRYSFDRLTVYGGIGTYVIPSSVRAKSSDYYDHDYDNDEGWFIGAEYEFHKDISGGIKFNMMSRIKSTPYDEWTKGVGLYFTYKF